MAKRYLHRTLLCIVFTSSTITFLTTGLEQSWKNSSSAIRNVPSRYENASSLLNDLLKDYDIRLRPGFGGEALLLQLDIVLASFDAMSEVNMDYTLTMYLHQYWKDDRLSWSSNTDIEEMILSGDFSSRIWVPDTFFANDKQSFLHDVTEKNKMLRVSKAGRVAYGMRFTTTLACHMDLRNYPLDSQNCTVEIESYGYTTTEVLMKWKQPHPVYGINETEVPQFEMMDYRTEDRIVKTATG
ncbi:hypothetical protein AB6A40_002324 [Gnathostoma spinigerum]|uniref:Gamma-aminobutyric acid receptor subunit beta n=1 Tax=Gnathostoma spinigerum TaxID=75299 RepID=A0ABD6EH19_9BILA